MRASDRISRRVTFRHLATGLPTPVLGSPSEGVRLLGQAALQLDRYEAWAGTFADTLDEARDTSAQDLGGNYVWQDELVDLWQQFTDIQKTLLEISDRLQVEDAATAAAAEPFFDPPTQAQIEFATEDPLFLDRTDFDRKQIAYDTGRLKTWHSNFMAWLEEARRSLTALSSKI